MATTRSKPTGVLKKNLLLVLTLIGVILGLAVGFAIRPFRPSENAIMWLGLPGELYLRLLKMMIAPLIVSSVITGTASLDPRANGKISMVAFTSIALANTFGAVLGVIVFVIFKPGQGVSDYGNNVVNTAQAVNTVDIFADLCRNIIPDNLFEATFSQDQTQYTFTTDAPTSTNEAIANQTTSNATKKVTKTLVRVGGANLLGLIFACTITGIAVGSIGLKGKVLIEFFEAASDTVIVIIQWFMWMTPVGVFSLILVAVADISDIDGVFKNLGVFIAAVTVGLVVQQLFVFPAVLFVFTRRNPYTHLFHLTKPWLIGFAAASSAIALPEMLRSCEVHLGVDKRVSRFVIPFGVTIGAQGSAIFIVCACLFISNVSGMPPSVGTVLTVGFMVAVSSLAIPAVPSASIVTVVMILTSQSIPVEAIALLLAVEFYLDRLRTASSLLGHIMCAVVTHHICKDYLISQDAMKDDIGMDISVEKDQIQEEVIPLKSTIQETIKT